MNTRGDIPVFPDVTPSSITKSGFHVIENDQIKSDQELNHLLQLMYDFAEHSFFLFRRQSDTLNPLIAQAMRSGLLLNRVTESFYYDHPNYAGKGNYVRIERGNIRFDWQREVIEKTPMYTRTTLELAEKARRRLALRELRAELDRGSPFFIRPSIWGVGVDLPKALKRLRELLSWRRTA